MTVHRFFLPADCFQGQRVLFPVAAGRQIQRVLRLGIGDRVVALDGSGIEHVVALDALGTRVSGSILESRRNEAEPAVSLTLYPGVLKGSKFEFVLQKGTELGVSRFVPLRTDRAVPQRSERARYERYGAIVREAAEQSERGCVPVVDQALDLAPALQRALSEGPALFCSERAAEQTVRSALKGVRADRVGIFVGPEGGFTPRETAAARQCGATLVTLGKCILRAETAAIVAAALALDALTPLE